MAKSESSQGRHVTNNSVRLTKLLRMLGSSHDGEVVNAARLIDAAFRRLGINWVDAFSPKNPSPAVMIAELKQQKGRTDWETKFLADLAPKVRERALSKNQYGVLRRMYRKAFKI